MESKGPYRIYDPGGSEPSPSTNKGVQTLMKDNPALRESMEGIRSLGELLEESENEVYRLRQKAEALVKDNKHLHSSSAMDSQPSFLEETVLGRKLSAGSEQAEGLQSPKMTDLDSDVHPKSNQKTPPSGTSSEFEILNAYETRKTPESRKLDPGPTLPQEDDNVQLHLQRMETSLSMFAEEPDRKSPIAHISRLALDFSRLASKVHKNEQKTAVLQTLCEQLRKENEDLRAKLEADWNQRTQAEQALRYENLELKKLILQSDRGGGKGFHAGGGVDSAAQEDAVKLENPGIQQVAKLMEKPAVKDPSVSLLKKVKILEHQRTELLEVNKQWDQQFRSMKMQYEEKITSLRQKLSQASKAESEQEVEKDRKQRDFDRKLLLARDKIEEKESQIQKLESEVRELKQKNKFLHEQLSSTSKQREYQEREISRLNKVFEQHQCFPQLKLRGLDARPRLALKRQFECQPLLNTVLLIQVKIFEEDFQKERRDRERMNEEKEELKRQLELLQTQLGQVNTQLRSCQEDLRREMESSRDAVRKQALGERYIVDPHMGHVCPPYQYPYSPPGLVYPAFEDWQIRYPPPVVHPEHSQIQDLNNVPPPAYPWRMATILPRMQNSKNKKKEQDIAGSGTQNAPRQT
uniref:TNFAIP3 interacting protein 1 n=1 Tax=Xenopus tropicalis TaxID=8364 RepID=A0A6I8SI53_XENTR